MLVLPTLLVVFLVIGIPLIYSLALSLHRINPLTQRWIFVGLANYARILPDPEFLAALGRTASFAVITVLGGLVLGMAMALVLNMAFVGRNVLRSLVLIPWAMSPVAVGILWSWMLNGDYGTFNAVLLSLGVIKRRSTGWAAARWRSSCRHRACLEPGAADFAADPGRPAVDARKPASRGADRRRRAAAALFQHHGALAASDAAAGDDPDQHQLHHGLRPVLDDDAWRPGQRDDRVLLDGLHLRLPVLSFRRRRRDPLCAHDRLPDPGVVLPKLFLPAEPRRRRRPETGVAAGRRRSPGGRRASSRPVFGPALAKLPDRRGRGFPDARAGRSPPACLSLCC